MPDIKEKKIFFLAVGFFLLLNLGAIFLSWQGRKLPPEPDDAGVFLIFLLANKDYNNVFSPKLKIFNRPFVWNEYGGLDRVTYFSWALFWGKLAKIISFSPENILQLSFYFGIVLFLASTLYFFKEKNWKFKTILVITLAFFTGDGTYQGFFWPASSLYSVSLFLFILKIILENDRKWLVKTLILFFIFSLIHPMSIIILFSIPIFIVFNRYVFKNKEIESIKKLIIFLIIASGFYIFWFKFLSLQNINLLNNTNVFKVVFTKLLEGNLTISNQAVKVILNQYFFYLVTRPFFLTLLVLGIIRGFKENKQLVVLFISFLILLIPAMLFTGGERILLFVWLLTFYIFSYGIEFVFEFFKNNDNKVILKVEKKLILLLLINLCLEFVFIMFIFKTNSAKDLILKQFFYLSKVTVLFLIILQKIFKKRLSLMLVVMGLMSFFGYLMLEKSAMIVFQRERVNIIFNKKLFLANIDPLTEGPIIYNDNLSFALFSSSGLMKREVIKRGYLQESDLEKAVYFAATKSKFRDCQTEKCFFEEQGVEKPMQRIAVDDYFLLYKF